MNCVSKTEKLELAGVIAPNTMKTHFPGLIQMLPLKMTPCSAFKGLTEKSKHVNFKYTSFYSECGPSHSFLVTLNYSDSVNMQTSSSAGTTQNLTLAVNDEEKCSL